MKLKGDDELGEETTYTIDLTLKITSVADIVKLRTADGNKAEADLNTKHILDGFDQSSANPDKIHWVASIPEIWYIHRTKNDVTDTLLKAADAQTIGDNKKNVLAKLKNFSGTLTADDFVNSVATGAPLTTEEAAGFSIKLAHIVKAGTTTLDGGDFTTPTVFVVESEVRGLTIDNFNATNHQLVLQGAGDTLWQLTKGTTTGYYTPTTDGSFDDANLIVKLDVAVTDSPLTQTTATIAPVIEDTNVSIPITAPLRQMCFCSPPPA